MALAAQGGAGAFEPRFHSYQNISASAVRGKVCFRIKPVRFCLGICHFVSTGILVHFCVVVLCLLWMPLWHVDGISLLSMCVWLLLVGKGDAPISDVDMVVDDVEQTGSGAKAPAAVPAGSPAKQQHKQKSSRWEDEDDAAAAVGDSAGTHVSEPEAGRSTAAEQSKGPGSTAHADSDGDEAAAAGTAGGNSRPKKKPKLSVQMNLDIDHEALLAGVNQVLEQLDSEDAVGLSSTPGSARARAAAIAAAGGDAVDDDVGLGDRAAAGRGAGSSMSIGGSYSSTGGKGGILKSASTPGSSKKKVRWPDDVPQEAELDRPSAGFSIARQRRQVRPGCCRTSAHKASMAAGHSSGITLAGQCTC